MSYGDPFLHRVPWNSPQSPLRAVRSTPGAAQPADVRDVPTRFAGSAKGDAMNLQFDTARVNPRERAGFGAKWCARCTCR